LDATERASEHRISQARRTPSTGTLGINLRLSGIYSGINFD
jgi:hypothetical protein